MARSLLGCAVFSQNQAVRAPDGSVEKTQETSLTAPHLKDQTVSTLIANLRQTLAKKGKVEEKDPCADNPARGNVHARAE